MCTICIYVCMCIVGLFTPGVYLTNNKSSMIQFVKICVYSPFGVHCINLCFCMSSGLHSSLYQHCHCKVMHVLCQSVASTSNYCCPRSKTCHAWLYTDNSLTSKVIYLEEGRKFLIRSSYFWLFLLLVKFRDFKLYTITECHRRKFQN